MIVRWRRGTYCYSIPAFLAPSSGLGLSTRLLQSALCMVVLGVQSIAQWSSFETIVPDSAPSRTESGFWATLFVWAPINSLLEQLLWLYIYEAFAR